MKSIAFTSICFLVIVAVESAYSPAIALELGYLSGASYQSQASIQAWSCSYCKKYPFSDPKVFTYGPYGVQGFTGYSHNLNAVVVAFRGSNNIQNWIVNIETTRTAYPLCANCSVHVGFNSAYNSVATLVRSGVQAMKAKYRGAKLMITGHSLGGALAILATADLKKLYGNVDLTYNYGQPRVGNPQFAQWFEKNHPNTFRLVDYADIVPHIPPSNLGFLHGSAQIWYQRGMQTYTICTAQAATCSNSISTTSYSTDDHSLDNYLKMKTVSEKQGILLNLLEKILNMSINKNLRGKQSQESANLWKNEQQRKVNEIMQKLRSEQTLKNES